MATSIYDWRSRHEPLLQVLVYDSEERCPYLPGQIARLPLRLPAARLSPQQLDACLARGDRRSGPFLYRTHCPGCQACIPIRIEVPAFRLTASLRRVFRRADSVLRSRIGPPQVDAQRVQLFNLHRRVRGLTTGEDDGDIDLPSYEAFLVDSCCPTVEIAYWAGQQLVAIAVCDVGQESLSAVYCYFDPAFGRLSPGTFSILKQLELCRRWDKRYLYLGYYVAQSSHMAYKARFRPHQQLLGGRWQTIDS